MGFKNGSATADRSTNIRSFVLSMPDPHLACNGGRRRRRGLRTSIFFDNDWVPLSG